MRDFLTKKKYNKIKQSYDIADKLHNFKFMVLILHFYGTH